MIEVERKYLVKNNSYKMQAQRAGLIVQGYLGDNPLSETRIAIRDNHGWLFIKAKGTLSRFEWQQEIPLYEAQELLKFCPNIIRKVRYIVYHMGNKWEIDEFLGENEGLVIAEIELPSEATQFDKPQWLGKEVTQDTTYYNSTLSKTSWKEIQKQHVEAKAWDDWRDSLVKK